METARIFDEENAQDSGGEPPIILNDRVYFANGNWRELDALGIRANLKDPYKKANMVLYYWETRLQEKSEEFARLKQGLLNHTRAVTAKRWADPPLSQNHIDKLKTLKKEVLRLQSKVQEAAKALEAAKPQVVKDREQRDAEIREEVSQAFDQIRAIEI